ncbi:GrpE, mitochondrial [Recurvomyces mirabilis]|nr:GrpE, mitochondrial [Recurvomyces mirabilis]
MIQRSLLRSVQNATRPSSSFRLPPQSRPFLTSRTAAPAVSSRLQGRRWYSEPAEAKKEDVAAEQADAQGMGDKATAAAGDGLQAQLEKKNKEVIEVTDRLKRQIAEYRNLQDQTKREVQAAKDFALQRFAKDLLDSVDNLDRALGGVDASKLAENGDLKNLHSGLKMTEEILMGTLKKNGMERFDPGETAEKFNPNTMEATFQAPQQGKEDGIVFYTQSKGFMLNGRVLRAAKVGVVKNS